MRLLDGDPFLYATGSEEAAGCVKAGIPFEVVPGVSAVTAVPAYAGVPLTVGEGAARCASSTSPRARVDWAAVAAGKATLVLLSATNGHRRRRQGAHRRPGATRRRRSR